MKFNKITSQLAAEIIFEHPVAETNAYEVVGDYLACGNEWGVDDYDLVDAVQTGFPYKHSGLGFSEVIDKLMKG